MLESSLKPGRGRLLGVPPVAKTNLVYGYELPPLVETFLPEKSTSVTSSLTVVTEPSLNQASSRRAILDVSSMMAFELEISS